MYINGLLKGAKVKLTSLKENDLQIIENWYNDIEFLRLYDVAAAFPLSETQLKERLDFLRKSNNRYIFGIRTIDNNKMIGIIGFEDIHWNNGVATLYIGLGDYHNRGKGYGMEALSLAIEFGFQELNFHRIQLNVLSYNEPAIKLYENLGFKREGIYREFIHRDDKRFDMFLYGLLRNEWEKR